MTGDAGELPQRETFHRALAAAHRARIVEELDRHPGGLDVANLARMLGLHPNTVRWHLGVLADSGFVSSHRGERTTPGRPPIVYTLRDDPELAQIESRDDYRLLATIAIGVLSDVADAHDRALAAGEAWGRYLVQRPQPGTRLSEAETIQAVVAFLAEQGFRPEAEGRQIRLHRCPFCENGDAADSSIARSIYRGLVSGALAELGSELEVERFDAFLEPPHCVATLAPRPAAREAPERAGG